MPGKLKRIKGALFGPLYKCAMLLADILKFGRIPLNLEIHASDHCNLNCMSCTHYSAIAEERYCDVDRLRKSLSILRRYDKLFDRIQILGGEPLLNDNLEAIFEAVRENFEHKTINLVSNGLLLLQPDKLPRNFWEAMRKYRINVRVSKYPIDVDYDEMARVCAGENVAFEISKDCSTGERWRKTMLDPEGKSNNKRSRYTRLRYCYLRDNLQLVGDKIFPCAQMAYVSHLNNAFGTRFETVDADYVCVDDLKNSWQIRKLVLFATPFCKYCDGKKEYFGWQNSSGRKDEWVKVD